MPKYKGIPEVHIRPTVIKEDYPGEKDPCNTLSWDAGFPIKKRYPPPFADVTIGHYVLDKLGDDQPVEGGTYATVRAHFEPTELGKILIDHGALDAPQVQKETNVYFAKDADGHIQAQLQD